MGRYYPQGIAWKLFNCFPQTMAPFRLVGQDSGCLVADTNHPLSAVPIDLEAHIVQRWDSAEEHGGSCTDIGDAITANGPGMQAPVPGQESAFLAAYPFSRPSDVDDLEFYREPRLVKHLDDNASAQVEALYGRLLGQNLKILDLMSSLASHLPESMDSCTVEGLGMNSIELQENSRLTGHTVHDLNLQPRLPYAENEFDSVICTSSIEYLLDPIEVLSDVTRVTRPGGLVVVTFSDRWFPGRQISAWEDLHPFERLGLVLDLFNHIPDLSKLHTETIRGFPRPLTDRHISRTLQADPIFAVWGTVGN